MYAQNESAGDTAEDLAAPRTRPEVRHLVPFAKSLVRVGGASWGIAVRRKYRDNRQGCNDLIENLSSL